MSTLYEKDFYAWCQEQAEYIKGHRFEDLDVVNLEDEICSLYRSEENRLGEVLIILFTHLLKCIYLKESFVFPYRYNSWNHTIQEQREKIKEMLEECPSLRKYLLEKYTWYYERSIYRAYQQTNLKHETFSEEMPFTIEQALDETWMPQ
jgi:hypothetical protein